MCRPLPTKDVRGWHYTWEKSAVPYFPGMNNPKERYDLKDTEGPKGLDCKKC